ncbi:MAG: trigger factor [Gemmatales bacterium]|nr:MAG: trigger factor [Gemmatales bacterium]
MTDETKTELEAESQEADAGTEKATTSPVEESAVATETNDSDETPTRLNQTVEMEDAGPCRKHVIVTIDREDIDRRMAEKFGELVAESNVPGFRPGKAPRKIVEKRFHKEVSDQVKAEILMQSLEQLAEEEKIVPLSPPDLDPATVEIPKEGPLVYEFEVEVRPEFELPDYKGLRLKRPVKEFSEEDISRAERRLLAADSQIVPKTDGAAELGDILVADVTIEHDGKVLAEHKELQLPVEYRTLFKDAVLPKFFERVKGAKAGDEREVDIVLTDEVADETLRGKKAKAKLKIHEIKTLRLPEGEEAYRELGAQNQEEFRSFVRAFLERRLKYVQRRSAREQVLEKIGEAAQWELPRDLLARQARHAMNRHVAEMRSAGMSDEEIENRLRLLRQDILASTAKTLKEFFVMQKIAEVENIEVTDDDIESEIERLAEEFGESPRRIRARLEQNDQLDSLSIEIAQRKVLDLICEHAEWEDLPYDENEELSIGSINQQAIPGKMRDALAEIEQETSSKEASTDTE